MATRLISLYDNNSYLKELENGWGLSYYIEHNGHKIIFDTGDDSERLQYNIDRLDINAKNVDFLVLSHNHWDHTGGLKAVLNKNKDIAVYFGSSFPYKFRKELSDHNIDYFTVDKITPIYKDVFVGPEMQRIGPPEIALALRHQKGLVIITGCAHPGIVHVIEELQNSICKDVYMVLGGFHLCHDTTRRAKEVIEGFRNLGVKRVSPCHCTGDMAIKAFQDEYQDNFIKGGSGLKIEI